jgi:hypothetical protein
MSDSEELKGVSPPSQPQAEEPSPEAPSGSGEGYWNIFIVAVLLFLLGVIGILVYGLYSQGGRSAMQNPAAITLSVPQEKIYLAAMTEYLCPCGACDLVFIECHCPTAQQAKLAVRRQLKRGATEGEITQLLEAAFKARRVGP